MVAALAGCATESANRRTSNQAETFNDIQYRAVLGDLAMIAHDPYLLPSYSVVNYGSVAVTDTFGVSGNVSMAKLPVGGLIDGNYSRSSNQNWTSEPVVAPEKLRALRLACQFVMVYHGVIPPETFRDGEHRVWLKNYTPPWGEPEGSWVAPAPPCYPTDAMPTPIARHVTSADPPGYYFGVLGDIRRSCCRPWLHFGTNKCEAKGAVYEAEYGGAVVWVCPEDMECFSTFVLAIQKICYQKMANIYQPVPQDLTFELAGVPMIAWKAQMAERNTVQWEWTQAPAPPPPQPFGEQAEPAGAGQEPLPKPEGKQDGAADAKKAPPPKVLVTTKADIFGYVGLPKARLEGQNVQLADQKLKSAISAASVKGP
jgi:hypothetical protein